MTSIFDDMAYIKDKSDSILGDPRESQEIVHDTAKERCNSCSWNTTVSDDEPIIKPLYRQIAEDDFIPTGNTYRACPWCEEPLERRL